MDRAYKEYVQDIKSFVPEKRIFVDELRRFAWGTDAGCYRITPHVVVLADTEKEVALLLASAAKYKLPVTFRAAGTALSGQSVTDSILIVAGKGWENYEVDAEMQTITMQPGLVGSRVNDILRPYYRCFGPDPASIGSCMVGGIVANNASGMSCGTHANSDKELVSARIVFYDGTVLDTGDEASRTEFAQKHGSVVSAIEELRDEIMSMCLIFGSNKKSPPTLNPPTTRTGTM